MEINGNNIITEDLQVIMLELRKQLELNGIQRFSKFIDSGSNLMTCCPFHKDGQERKPSFGIHKKDGTCHCFGCGWIGSLPEMISNCFGYDDLGNFGTKWLIKNFVSIQVETRQDINLSLDRNSKATKKEIKYVLDDELETYRVYHSYMWKRKLTPEIVELFDIGYDKDTDCLTFPQRDIYGNTLFIARRSVSTKFFNYPTDVEKPVYGLYELSLVSKDLDYKIVAEKGKLSRIHKIDEVIICESMLDALYFWTIGKYAVALNGLGTQSQFDQLNRLPCRKFILCTDNDAAGMKARKRIRENLKNKLVTEYILPQGRKDANDCTIEELQSLQEVF